MHGKIWKASEGAGAQNATKMSREQQERSNRAFWRPRRWEEYFCVACAVQALQVVLCCMFNIVCPEWYSRGSKWDPKSTQAGQKADLQEYESCGKNSLRDQARSSPAVRSSSQNMSEQAWHERQLRQVTSVTRKTKLQPLRWFV